MSQSLPLSAVPILILLSIFFAGGPVPAHQTQFESKTVLIRVSALDKDGRPVLGLKREQFNVFEKNNQLEIGSFDSSNEPASILFMFDVSASMSPKVRNLAAQWVRSLTRLNDNSYDYSIMLFNKKAAVICGWKCRESALNDALNYLSQVKPDPSTVLYDAFALALKHLESSEHQKRIIIAFTDGQDTSSKMTFKVLRHTLRESSVTFYAIGIVADSDLGSSLGIEGQSILDELAQVSGGKAYLMRNQKDYQESVSLIADEIRHQYTLGIVIAKPRRDQKWHEIKIKITAPQGEAGKKLSKVWLRYRESYFDQ